MLADQLIWAVAQGRTERVALLLANGVDPNVSGSGHPTHEDRTAYEWAVYTGSTEIAALLAAAGARPPRSPIDAVDRFLARLSARTRRRSGRRPGSVGGRGPASTRGRRAGRRPAPPGAVRLLVEAGFSVHGAGRTTPLHLAAYNGDLPMVRLLVDLGADPRREDPEYHSTPLGWAEHAGAEEVADYLADTAP